MNINELKKQGICPTCHNRKYGGVYLPLGERLIYEDDFLECFFEEHPRSIGHVIILTKEHFNDMSYVSDEVSDYVFRFSKNMMNVLKEVLKVERVYLCTMCDGDINHFHVQLIPRHPGEKIGSTNFVKERKDYIHDEIIVNKTRGLINKIMNK